MRVAKKDGRGGEGGKLGTHTHIPQNGVFCHGSLEDEGPAGKHGQNGKADRRERVVPRPHNGSTQPLCVCVCWRVCVNISRGVLVWVWKSRGVLVCGWVGVGQGPALGGCCVCADAALWKMRDQPANTVRTARLTAASV